VPRGWLGVVSLLDWIAPLVECFAMGSWNLLSTPDLGAASLQLEEKLRGGLWPIVNPDCSYSLPVADMVTTKVRWV
jgi:hypothetical protein